MSYSLQMRSLRSRMRHPVCVYGKRGGSPCVYIPILGARSLSPSPRTPLSQKRPHYSHWPFAFGTRSASKWPKRWGQSGKGARCAPLSCLRLPVSVKRYVATQMIKATGCTQKV